MIHELLAMVGGQDFRNAKPFPHVFVDGALSFEECLEVVRCFPHRLWPHWKIHANKNTLKRDCGKIDLIPGPARQVIEELNSRWVVDELARITGLTLGMQSHPLVSDPNLEGGGMHRIDKGGWLNIHRDFNLTPDRKLRRVLNAILYLNDCEGGDLELQGALGDSKQIRPRPGRLVIFDTAHPAAWHGHPRPLESEFRFSLATYYYMPAGDTKDRHLTIYR